MTHIWTVNHALWIAEGETSNFSIGRDGTQNTPRRLVHEPPGRLCHVSVPWLRPAFGASHGGHHGQ
eukprot:13281-Eustigmatos_ZCMA.PRE.1